MNTEFFWQWFIENEDIIYEFEDNIEIIFDAIAVEMVKVDESVTFEISSKDESGKRQFVVTAGGLRSSFPAVEALIDSAPALNRWTFVKYRQRAANLSIVEFDGMKVDPADVHCVIVKDQSPSKVGVLLFFDGYIEKQRELFGNIGYLILDQALGEYVVETRVGIIEMFDRSSEYYLSARPVKELGSYFDDIVDRLDSIKEDEPQ
jgi:hypothetical protein